MSVADVVFVVSLMDTDGNSVKNNDMLNTLDEELKNPNSNAWTLIKDEFWPELLFGKIN